MVINESCYLCGNLRYFDSEDLDGYYCIITDRKYLYKPLDLKCTCFCEEIEE